MNELVEFVSTFLSGDGTFFDLETVLAVALAGVLFVQVVKRLFALREGGGLSPQTLTTMAFLFQLVLITLIAVWHISQSGGAYTGEDGEFLVDAFIEGAVLRWILAFMASIALQQSAYKLFGWLEVPLFADSED